MLMAGAPEFLAHANIGYVVIDEERASLALVSFAVRALHLEALASDGSFVLYSPVSSLVSREPSRHLSALVPPQTGWIAN